MSEIAKAAVVMVALLLGLPILIFWLYDRIENARWRRANPPEKIAADRRAREARILSPDWAFYEQHLQRPAPSELRELYADQPLVTACCLEFLHGDHINSFAPLDEQELIDSRQWFGFDVVAIATSDFGDPIYLRPGASQSNQVYITHHDGGDTQVFAESIAEMVQKLRLANPATKQPA